MAKVTEKQICMAALATVIAALDAGLSEMNHDETEVEEFDSIWSDLCDDDDEKGKEKFYENVGVKEQEILAKLCKELEDLKAS